MFTHARGDGCVQTYARGQPIVPILANERRRDCGLPRLDLVSTRISQRYELSRALEIIVHAVGGGDVRTG
jgi:hypothetical protein